MNNTHSSNANNGLKGVGHRPENTVAGALYESLGFKRISRELIDGEVVRLLS